MRYLYFLLLLGFLAACTQDDPAPYVDQVVPAVEKGLVVDIQFVTTDPCGEGGHGLAGIDMLLKRVISDGEAYLVEEKLTDNNGRVVFDPEDTATYIIRGELDRGYEEMEVEFEAGSLKRVTLLF